jgi:diketogulonate reductase-like aldo/keto reductase
MGDDHITSRRRFLGQLGALGITAVLPVTPALSAAAKNITKPIPATGEPLPVVGMGSWLTFDVGNDIDARNARLAVLQTFFDLGGGLVDSSPMYGSSEEVIGYCLKRIRNHPHLFAATKVWTVGRLTGINEMELSRRRWGIPRFDLMQIHNMLDWETHLETLTNWKAEGRIRYIGITTSHGRRHDELERALKTHPFDFVQFTYNLIDREVEQRLLPLAAERGIAVVINRPFRHGELFRYVRGRPLPKWAVEFDCENWAQFFLKFIVSHPAVTCAIPATTKVAHMKQNMGAARGKLPDAATRRRMADHFRTL